MLKSISEALQCAAINHTKLRWINGYSKVKFASFGTGGDSKTNICEILSHEFHRIYYRKGRVDTALGVFFPH